MSSAASRPEAARPRAAAARLGFAATAVLAAMLLQAAPSVAGEYHVYSCRVPRGALAGEPAPVQEAVGGGEEPGRWSHAASGLVLHSDQCATGGSLTAALPAATSHSESDLSTWLFSSPSGETITNATLWRAGDADGGEGYVVWLASPTDPSAASAIGSAHTFDGCSWLGGCTGVGNTAEPLSPENEVTVPAGNLPSSHLYINASCSKTSCPGGAGDPQGYAAVIYMYAADIVLDDPTPPTVSEVSGTLMSEATLSGEAHLHFDASDAGSGVYEAIVKVDGKTLQQGVIDELGGRCRPLEILPEGEPAFLYAQPCPSTATAEVSLNTSALTNGAHTLLVQVSDAAGNTAVVLERTIDVSNSASGEGAGAPSGSGSAGSPSAGSGAQTQLASGLPGGLAGHGGAARANGIDPSARALLSARWLRGQASGRRGGRGRARGALARGHRNRARNRRQRRGRPRHAGSRSSLTGPFDTAQTIAGRLSAPGGTPIAQAIITVTATPGYGGAKPRRLHPVRTGASGRFRLALPASLPSARIRLAYASSIGGRPVATATLALSVQASLTLHVSPARTSAGHTIELRGRLLGGPIPAGGKQVILEAKSKGTPWLQFHVLSTGRGGSFHATHRFRLPGPMRYRFRAVCPREADFPFARGASKVASVFER